jgi:K+ transporter
MMLIWFGMLAILGIAQITQNTAVKAINLIMLSFIKHPS